MKFPPLPPLAAPSALLLAAALCGGLARPVEAQGKPGAKAPAPKATTAPKPADKKPAEKPAPAPKPQPAAKPGAGAAAKPEGTKPQAAKPGAAKPKPGSTAKPTDAEKGAKKPKPQKNDASVAFFRDGVVPRLKIVISNEELQRLRQSNREYVRCTVIEEGGKQYEHVGIHLKGAAGSFRGVDDKPALTLNFDKFKEKQTFHDLDKIHLNNSVQDPGYLNELISSELFLAAGVPAARTTHARVWLNDRDLGFYVLKEGFNKRFLKRHFQDPDGNLYEAGLAQELNGQLSLKNGEGPTDRSDVKALIDACQEPDAAKRWERLERLVEIDRFLSFVAMELMTSHWDGYCNNRNNYRFYFEPKSGKVHFFPHGMDQMFADPNASVLNVPGAMLAGAVLRNPEWRGRYRDRLSELMTLFVPAERLQKRVDEHHRRLRPVLAQMSEGQAADFDRRAQELKNRLEARAKNLLQQNAVVEPRPLSFNAQGIAPLTRWEPKQETPDARLEKLDTGGGVPKGGSLAITAGASGRCVASWRATVILPAGKYRLEARAKAQDVKALAEGPGTGAGLRLSGGSRANKLEGTADWTPLVHEFDIQQPTQQVVLVAELRAASGRASFDAGSLRLVRVSR